MGEGLEHGRYGDELGAETARLGALVLDLAPESPVPSCPEWTVRDLVTHVGTGHRWSAGIVEQRMQTMPEYALAEAPPEQGEWPAWLTAGARRLIEAIRDAGPTAPVWTWRPDRTAEFWLRKMLHDLVVHRYDVEQALGRPPGELAADLAADGISDMMQTARTLSLPRYSHPVFGDLAGAGETLRFEATDPDLAEPVWHVERTPEGIAWQRTATPGAEATVVVRAPARELLLVLNRRLRPDHGAVEITGEWSGLDHWLTHTTF